MELYYLIFSPYQALGLPPLSRNTAVSEKDDHKAWRKVIRNAWAQGLRRTHPDKTGRPADQFPLLEHIYEAKDYLLQFLCNIEAITRYYAPWPDSVPYQPMDPSDPGNRFAQCPTCRMVLQRHSLHKHVNFHQQELCGTCGVIVSYDDLERHMREAHKPPRPRTFYKCPICGKRQDLDEIQTHLWVQHLVQRCGEGCDLSEEHFDECHPTQLCFACMEYCATNMLEGHFLKTHELRKCPNCHCDNLMDWLSHLLDHDWIECNVCRLQIQQDSYDVHLLRAHLWKECEFCRQPQRPDDLDAHIAAHTIRQCPACSKQVVEEGYPEHLVADHEYKSCPFCASDPMTPDDLKLHIMESHLDIEVCRPEGKRHEAESSFTPQLQKEPYVKCHFCPVAKPKRLLGEHVLQKHPHEPGVCDQCGVYAPKPRNLYEHRRRRHGYREGAHKTLKHEQIWCENCQKNHSKPNMARCRQRKK